MTLCAPLDSLQLTGRCDSHIETVPGSPGLRLHRAAIQPWLALREAAAAEGLQLQAVSGFRDFARQRAIWNAKCRGDRPALDRDGRPVDVRALAPREVVDTVLNWSALPGASRHHWGSEIDLIDLARWPAGLPWRLEPADFATSGPCAELDAWLDAQAATLGFYRPYARDLGGVQPEPWHVSFAPVSVPATAALVVDLLGEALAGGDVACAADILGRLESLHARQVLAVEAPPAHLLARLTAASASRLS
ncbi:MAG: hypothetical protein RL026_53 [Pseudomonadota bacterium]